VKLFQSVTTIYDIAKAAQTSPASVSRVINDRGGVKLEAVIRIKQAMRTLKFQPRWRAMDRDRFLVFIPEYKKALSGGYVAGVMSGIVDEAFANGFGLLLRPFSARGKEIRDLRQLYMRESVSGCILLSMSQGYSLPEQLDVAGLPHVVIGNKLQDNEIHQVLLDDLQAGRDAGEFLLSLGHRRIAMVSFNHLEHGHRDRYQGFSEVIEGAIQKKPPCLQCNDSSYEAGGSAARQLLSPLDRPTAVVITNEELALGFQAEAKRMGFTIPQDISLIAFEETEKLSLLSTPLTAMQTSAYIMGLESVKMLQSMISGNTKIGGDSQADYMTKRIPIPLIARHSTASISL
jgi:LacI family transcriptional regulator